LPSKQPEAKIESKPLVLLLIQMATIPQMATAADSRKFRLHIRYTCKPLATIIMTNVQVISSTPQPFHRIFVSQVAALATAATVIQPKYAANGQNTKR